MKLKKVFRAIKNKDFGLLLFNRLLNREKKKHLFEPNRNFEFLPRNSFNGYKRLLIVLAGFQPLFWDVVLKRVFEYTKKCQIDVCIAIPGVNVQAKKQLFSFCDKYGFASFYCREDRLAAIQNTIIKLYPKADLIFKIDEDIIIGPHFFLGLEKGLSHEILNSRFKVGFAVPMKNIDIFSYIFYLQSVDSLSDFDSKFGKAFFGRKQKIQNSPDVALYIWDTLKGKSFNQVESEIYQKNKDKYVQCSSRYSIGALLITRETWEEMGYFDVGQIGAMGVEEYSLCCYSMDIACEIVCCLDTMVGHLGYYTQKEICQNFFKDNLEKFSI